MAVGKMFVLLRAIKFITRKKIEFSPAKKDFKKIEIFKNAAKFKLAFLSVFSNYLPFQKFYDLSYFFCMICFKSGIIILGARITALGN